MEDILFRPMTTDDVAQIESIANTSFPTPWSVKTFWREIEKNERGHYWVLTSQAPRLLENHRQCHLGSEKNGESRVLSYGGYWLLGEEAHIVTVATHPSWRQLGMGKLLLLNMILDAESAGAQTISLEVRESNHAAINLYKYAGFIEEGRRKDYYTINKSSSEREDALILTLSEICTEQYPDQIKQHRRVIRSKIAAIASNLA